MIKITITELLDILISAKHWYKNFENLEDEFFKNRFERIQELLEKVNNLKSYNYEIIESGE